MKSSALRPRFAQILAATLAAGAAVTSACGGATSDGGSSSGGSSSGGSSSSSGGGGDVIDLCLARSTPGYPQGLAPSPPVDFLGMVGEQAFGTDADAGDGGDGFRRGVNAQVGQPCSGASNPATCMKAYDSFRVLPTDEATCLAQYPWTGMVVLPGCTVSYLLWTRGDEVHASITPAEVRALIGPIDTPDEALWELAQAGYSRACGGTGAPPSTIRKVDGGYEIVFQKNCDTQAVLYKVRVGTDGTVTLLESTPLGPEQKASCAVAGRRPEGFTPNGAEGASVGAYFASMAALEAAAIHAFRRTVRELEALGAPRELVARTRQAVKDEVRHTRTTRELARAHGAEVRLPRVDVPTTLRSAFELALENAREGCVRETWGALVAMRQASCVADLETRAALAIIAEEETSHAELSWDLAAWLDGQLDAAQRARVAEERERAMTELAREIRIDVAPALAEATGLPRAAESVMLFDALVETLRAA